MMQNCILTVRNETKNKLEFKEMQITNTVICDYFHIMTQTMRIRGIRGGS